MKNDKGPNWQGVVDAIEVIVWCCIPIVIVFACKMCGF